MRATPLLVVLLALLASMTLASEVTPIVTSAVTATVPAAINAGTVEVVVPVSSFVENRHELDCGDLAYLATVPEEGLRERARQLMVADIHHRPASGRWQSGDGTRIDTMYQVWTAPYQARVRIPQPRVEVEYVEKPLPPLGELNVRHTEPLRLQPIEADLVPVGMAMAPCVSEPYQQPARSLVIGRQGSSEEHPIGSAWGSWERQPVQKVCPPGPPPPPPPGPYCPPGVAPPGPTPPQADVPGVPGDGSQGSGGGTDNYVSQPEPPPGYGSGNDTVPPGVGPLPPDSGQPPPAVPPSGGSPVTPVI